MNSLSEANTKFMFDLFQQFRKSQKNNTFYSPISITTALGMVLLGAKDNTAQQINKVGISFLRCPVTASLCGSGGSHADGNRCSGLMGSAGG